MRRHAAAPWLWLCPAAAVLIPFFLMPLAIVVRNSIYYDDPMGLLVPTFTLENYAKVLSDAYYLSIFLHTAAVAAIVTVAAVLVGYPFAQIIAQSPDATASLLLWCVYVPLYVSVIMRAFGWTIVLADSGLLNMFLLSMHLIERPLQILYRAEGMTVGMFHRYLPLMVIPLVSALRKVDGDLLKASANLGASPRLTWWRVVLPLSLPGIAAGSQLVFAGVLSDYALPALMGSADFQLTAPAIYYEAVTNSSWGLAGAMATIVLGATALFLLAMNMILRRLAPWRHPS